MLCTSLRAIRCRLGLVTGMKRWAWPAYVALSAADTALAGSRSPRARRLRFVTKPLLMPVLAVVTTPATERPLGKTVVAAQLLSGVGDVALLGRSDRAFLAGLSSFFAAHLAYVGGFATSGRPVADAGSWRGAKVAAATFAIAAPVSGWNAGRQNPALRWPVTAYVGVLCSMVATSTRLSRDLPPSASRTILAGTTLFLASDSILSAQQFLLPEPEPAVEAAVMATYTAGQGLIAAGVLRAVGAAKH